MKARIPKVKFHNAPFLFDSESLIYSEETMKHTWNELRDALARKEFEYTDTNRALSITFLKQFNDWFQGIGKDELTINLSDYFNAKHIGRGTIIKPSEPIETPSHDRFLPVSKFITEDNRFSPPGVEWLYLTIGKTYNIIKECAEKECRAKANDRFAFCNFQINPVHANLKIVDLTIADEMTYDAINKKLLQLAEKEYDKSSKYAKKYGYWVYKTNYKNDSLKQEIAKWSLHTYAIMMSKNLFVPIESDDKKLVYAPFQTLAMYFISEGFDGIIYSSTVCPKAKNIVLFDKNYALPCGDISDYIIS